MEVKGKLNKISNGQYGVGILVAGFDGFINTKDSINDIKVKEGDFVEVKVTQVSGKNGQTYNNFKAKDLVAVAGEATPTPSGSKKNYTSKSTYDSDAPVRGMAFNNAIQIAIALKKTADRDFIKNTTLELYNLVKEIEQGLSVEKKSSPETVADITADDLDDDLDSVFAKAV